MSNLHPDVLVIENTLNDDNSELVKTNAGYGHTYVRLDAVPRGGFWDNVLIAALFLLMLVDAVLDKTWILAGTGIFAMAASVWLAIKYHRQWKAIKNAEVEAGK